MPDDKSIRGPQDASRVNVNQDHEVAYWCRKFGCTPSELKAAVKAVGVSSSAVERHLKNARRR